MHKKLPTSFKKILSAGFAMSLAWFQVNAQPVCNGPNLLLNPSFEAPIAPNGNGANNIVASIPGWTNLSSTSTSVNIVRPTGNGVIGPASGHEGEQYIDLQGSSGVMQQSFTITEPVQLSFSGNFANRGTQLPGYTGGQIAIQILGADLVTSYAAVSGSLTAASGNNTWITLNGLTSVLQPGTYVYRFFGLTDFAHYDDFSLCVATNAAQSCSDRTVLKPQPGWSATASSSFSNLPASKAIDGSTRDAVDGTASAWATATTSPTGQYVIFDYGSPLNLVGFVYYPRIDVAQNISGYTIEYSNDGINFTTLQDGSMKKQNTFGSNPSIRVGDPIEVNFISGVSARYMRLIVRGTYEPNEYAAIAELLPIVCGSPSLNTISCVNANLLNTGTNVTGDGTATLDTFDANWEVAFVPNAGASYTNSLPPLSSVSNATFMPAIVSGNKVPGFWANSPFGNAQWISYTETSRDGNGSVNEPNTYFFRYRFNITDAYLLSAFKLKLNFLTDNVNKNIFVNGTGMAPQFGLPGGGFYLNDQTETSLNSGWVLGANEIIVQLYSQPPYTGFLGQNVATCPGLDFGDAPASYNVSRTSFGAGHIVETDATGNITLKLGALVDTEDDGLASLGTSDNTTEINDEDGVSSFPGIPTGTNPTITNYTVNVAVANITGSTANLCGWIDWDHNGTFDASESVCTTVNNNATSAQLTWTSAIFNGSVGSGTYARFRITTDALSSPNGATSNGEVEDYLISFTALPVTLVSFEAVKSENSSLLTWATTEETNSDRFEIEHSLDGKKWSMIGKVKSHGESATVKKYSFVDNSPSKSENLYRLRMVDKDQTFAFSRIRSLTFDSGLDMIAYPNPATDRLLIANFDKVKQVIIVNDSGIKVIRSGKVSADGIDVRKLAPGTYILNITLFDGTQTTHKIIVVR